VQRSRRCARLHVHQPAWLENSGQPPEKGCPRIHGKRGIEKHHVISMSAAAKECSGLGVMGRIAGTFELRNTQFFCALPQLAHHGTLTIHRIDAIRPARQRLQTQRPAASEKVETGFSCHRLSQPVEQGFAYPVSGGPQAFTGGKSDAPAAKDATNDAQLLDDTTAARCPDRLGRALAARAFSER
jgi:hypothetical protein